MQALNSTFKPPMEYTYRQYDNNYIAHKEIGEGEDINDIYKTIIDSYELHTSYLNHTYTTFLYIYNIY